MTKNRYAILDNATTKRVRLTAKEIKRGWHFCPEFDGSLERLVPCGCMRFGFRKRERNALAKAERWKRQYQNYLCNLADVNAF